MAARAELATDFMKAVSDRERFPDSSRPRVHSANELLDQDLAIDFHPGAVVTCGLPHSSRGDERAPCRLPFQFGLDPLVRRAPDEVNTEPRARPVNVKAATIVARDFTTLRLEAEAVAEFPYQPTACAQP